MHIYFTYIIYTIYSLPVYISLLIIKIIQLNVLQSYSHLDINLNDSVTTFIKVE